MAPSATPFVYVPVFDPAVSTAAVPVLSFPRQYADGESARISSLYGVGAAVTVNVTVLLVPVFPATSDWVACAV